MALYKGYFGFYVDLEVGTRNSAASAERRFIAALTSQLLGFAGNVACEAER